MSSAEIKAWEALLDVMKESHDAEVAQLREQCSGYHETIRLLIENEPVWASFWGRDCDMCESTYTRYFESEVELQRYWADECENAEGPVAFERLTKEEFDEFEASFRDRALEAYEDGRGNHHLI